MGARPRSRARHQARTARGQQGPGLLAVRGRPGRPGHPVPPPPRQRGAADRARRRARAADSRRHPDRVQGRRGRLPDWIGRSPPAAQHLDAPARYVLVSTMVFPEVAEQLDTGTILAMSDPGTGWAFAAGSEGDYVQLTIEAIQADQGP